MKENRPPSVKRKLARVKATQAALPIQSRNSKLKKPRKKPRKHLPKAGDGDGTIGITKRETHFEDAARCYANKYFKKHRGTASKDAAIAHGVHPLRKIVDGKPTDEISIQFWVNSKESDIERIPKRLQIPATLPWKGQLLKTDVVEVGIAKPYIEVNPGEGLSVDNNGRGTLAFVVTAMMPNSGNSPQTGLFLLCSNHVISCNGTLTNSFVEHPPRWPGISSIMVGQVATHFPINAQQWNYIDAALALTQLDRVAPLLVQQFDYATEPIPPAISMEVFKFGAASNFTKGQIISVSCNQQFDYESLGMGRPYFTELIAIEGLDGPFSQPGDSGAAVFRNASDASLRNPVAMIVGGAEMNFAGAVRHITFASPIERVLNCWGARIWKG